MIERRVPDENDGEWRLKESYSKGVVLACGDWPCVML